MIVDYYFSVSSPWCYLGHGEFHRIARNAGTAIRYIPVALEKLYVAGGGTTVTERPRCRQDYRFLELARWRRRRNVPLNLRPRHFGPRKWPATGMVLTARDRGIDCGPLIYAFMRAAWVEDLDLGEPERAVEIADRAGFEGRNLLENMDEPRLLQEYERTTSEAVARGVFGIPTYVVDGELFWGQDRLDFVEEAIHERSRRTARA